MSTQQKVLEIQSTLIFDDVLHYAMLPNGDSDEGWGNDGVERILETHVDTDVSIAKAFFRKMEADLRRGYEMIVTILDDGDVSDIRIRRGHQTLQYPNSFVLFESPQLAD